MWPPSAHAFQSLPEVWQVVIAYLEFAAVCIGLGVLGLFFWDDMTDLYDREQHELLLDELWADDDDLAESA